MNGTSLLDAGSSLRSDTEPEDELEASRMLFPAAIPTSLLNESCDGDVEDETLPEPGTTRGTKIVRVADNTLPIFDQSWLLTADPLIGVSVFFAEFSKR